MFKGKFREFYKSKIIEGIKIRELSIGLIYAMEEKIKDDKITTILKECSDLSEKEINALGFSFAKSLYDEILKLTYGEAQGEARQGKKK